MRKLDKRISIPTVNGVCQLQRSIFRASRASPSKRSSADFLRASPFVELFLANAFYFDVSNGRSLAVSPISESSGTEFVLDMEVVHSSMTVVASSSVFQETVD
jgi:hypothetical protein